MTDPIIQLETTQLTVEPGGQGRTLVTVRNLGNIVEGFALQVLGEGVSEWSEVTPAEVQVYPEQEATAVVVFSPPAGNTTRSGSFPFAVRAESVVDPDVSAVAEGDLEIGRVFGLQTKITPVTSSGRWRGKHFLEITNWGNAPVQLKLTATDPDEKLAFLIGPELIDLPLGVTAHAQLRVRTLKPFLRGAQVRHPFQLVGEPDPPEVQTGPPSMIPNPRRATIDAAFVQRPILSKWTIIVALLLVAAIIGAIVWALTRPSEEEIGLSQGSPKTPTLSVVPGDATSVKLLWQAQPNIQTYNIIRLDAQGNNEGVTPVDGQLEAQTIGELQPLTQYCFQLQAIRADQKSPLSEKQCATTTAAPEASPSPSPSPSAEVSPSPSAGPSASPSGEAPASSGAVPSSPGGAGQSAGQSGGAGLPGVPGVPGGNGQAGGATTAPNGGGQTTGPGAPTTPANGTVVPPDGGGFGPSQAISVYGYFPAADSEAQGRAEFFRQQQVAAGIPAQVLRTRDFPRLQIIPGSTPADTFVVYVGPFNTLAEAQNRCATQPSLGTQCRAVIPSPPA